MLRIPRLRQPNSVACLPTCVRAVLAYHGRQVSDDEAAEMCRTDSAGTVADLAVQGLAEAGIDAEFRQFGSLDDLREWLLDGSPIITFLWHPAGSAHAVVVCDVSADTVTVMDPALGDCIELPIAQFEALWCDLDNGGIVIGHARWRMPDTRRASRNREG